MDMLRDRRLLAAVLIALAAAAAALLASIAVPLAVAAAGLACWLALAPNRAPTPPAEPAATAEPGLAAVAASIDDPLLFVERQRVTHANAAALALLGDHILDDDARLAIRHPAASTAFSGVAPARPVMLGALGHGGQHWEMSVHPVGAGGLLVRLADRSAGLDAERMRVDFVANASHELRTPLATLLGFIETLQTANGPEDAATRTRFLGTMLREAKRMQRLIEDLISLSRIEAERHSAPQAAVSLDLLAREVQVAIAGAHSLAAGRIMVVADDALPPVAGDRAQLSQLLHNLIGNALKYGRPDGPVRVRLSHGLEGVRLSVEDEGAGIPREHLPRLTERFYRVDAGRSRAVGGTGLGLAIVKHIAERHRARLDIASEVGRGTVVSLLFPPAAEALSSNGHANVTQDASTPIKGVATDA